MPLTGTSPPIDMGYLIDNDWWSRVEVTTSDPDECWEWQQSTGSHGYGQTWDGQTVRLAHRVAWELTHGPIPPRMTIDHKCRNRTCCNPHHLRIMSNVDNARDNGQGRKTHCPSGHRYDEANTYINKRGWRTCRACARRSKGRT